MNPLIIGAPFGNYFKVPGATSTVGTFTCENRGGLWYRLWRVARTVRYYPSLQSWKNRLGLPNPGLASHKGKFKEDEIVSIHGKNCQEWVWLVAQCSYSNLKLHIEFNLSCPNVKIEYLIQELKPAIKTAIDHGHTVIAKLPPIGWFEMTVALHRWGVRYFHCCNTYPTPGGGMSGKILKPLSLEVVEHVRDLFGNNDCKIIGGGGITTYQDVKDYLNAGANYVSVASMLFWPWKWRLLRKFVECLDARKDGFQT